MTRTLLACLVLLACQSEEHQNESQLFAAESVSLAPPKGWEVRHDRDTLVFLGGSPRDRSRATIAVRMVPVSGWSEPRSLETVLPDTEAVLRALPGAQVSGPTDVDHAIYRAKAFDVTWTPRSRKGQRYQRRHVTVEAHQHLFHVYLTAPEGHLDASRRDLDRVIETLREEG